jgi:hypothetical protein
MLARIMGVTFGPFVWPQIGQFICLAAEREFVPLVQKLHSSPHLPTRNHPSSPN